MCIIDPEQLAHINLENMFLNTLPCVRVYFRQVIVYKLVKGKYNI